MTRPSSTPDAGASTGGVAGRLRGLASSTFLRHVLTLMTGTALAQVVPIAARPLMTRWMYDDRQFGLFTAYLSIVGAFVVIGAARYDMAVVMPERDADARALVRLCSRISLGVSVVLVVALTLLRHQVAALMNQPHLAGYLPMVGVAVFCMTQLSARQYWLNRNQRYKEIARNRMGQSITSTAGQLALGVPRMLGAGLGAWGLVLGHLAGQVFSLANLWRLTRHETRPQPGDSMAKVAAEHKKMPLVNGPNAIVDAIRVNGINLLTGAYFSLQVLGQFGQAWQLLQLPMSLINGALSQVFYQRLATTPRGAMFPLVRATVKRSVLVGLVPFTLLWLLSPWLFPLFLGNGWALSGDIARALVPWLFVNFITSPISLVFVTVGRQGTMFCHAVVFMVVPLALIRLFHTDILATMQLVSWSMAALLVVFVVLALWVSRQYDQGHGGTPEQTARQALAADAEADVEATDLGAEEGFTGR